MADGRRLRVGQFVHLHETGAGPRLTLMFIAVRFSLAAIVILGRCGMPAGPKSAPASRSACCSGLGSCFRPPDSSARRRAVRPLSPVSPAFWCRWSHLSSIACRQGSEPWPASPSRRSAPICLPLRTPAVSTSATTLTVGCAFLFAGHIVAATHFARRFDPIRLLAVQFGNFGDTLVRRGAAPRKTAVRAERRRGDHDRPARAHRPLVILHAAAGAAGRSARRTPRSCFCWSRWSRPPSTLSWWMNDSRPYGGSAVRSRWQPSRFR